MYLPLHGLYLAAAQQNVDFSESFLYFIFGFSLASVIALVMLLVASELQKKRAVAFTKRFAVLSEGLSSFKALSFRISTQLKKIRSHWQQGEVSKAEAKKILLYVDGLLYLFDNLSAGMVPPTEEIAMSALTGKKTSLEQRAYEDSIKFRDEIRQLRHLLEKSGLEGLAQKRQETKIQDS